MPDEICVYPTTVNPSGLQRDGFLNPEMPSILVVLDDTLVRKCGKHIQGTYAWFDHTSRRVMTSLRRWRIEEAHRDLKQQFGLPKCQAHQAWVVSGFIGLVYLGYSLWKLEKWMALQREIKSLKCPSWATEFSREQIYLELLAMS